jgi:hypothetical protein
MTPSRPKKSNRDVERRYFEAFRQAYTLPSGVVEYADRPDILVNGERTTGIELTRFYLQPGGSLGSEQRQMPLRRSVVSDAHKLHLSNGGRKFELTIGFDTARPITSVRKRTLAKELVALGAALSADERGPVDPERFEASPEISSIYLNNKEYEDAKWSVCQVYSVDLMSPTELEKIVREKESKAAEYLPCDSYWLLIIVDYMDNAQEQEVSVRHVRIASTVFEKIIVYKPGFNDILQVWP